MGLSIPTNDTYTSALLGMLGCLLLAHGHLEPRSVLLCSIYI